ncbi:hypothetical protein L228DRAFT_180851 [Xylona heveae TC161]|uniref:Uncharacterized protein n=1 Tax=Xylona heveae (strain CBS 132557 / TC161) TaxID=1328760 RepID=A0A165FE08_XYLHT|nr:hypothetical protein L228DRAFT_180851 [Xylona heveae TC161]KZF20868.1 hypothetical protein L228DRAFT_180851 [Xylona heveae TC161]
MQMFGKGMYCSRHHEGCVVSAAVTNLCPNKPHGALLSLQIGQTGDSYVQCQQFSFPGDATLNEPFTPRSVTSPLGRLSCLSEFFES